MKKLITLLLLGALAGGSQAALADTIYLKNGSTLKGKVTSFANDEFVVMLDLGGRSSSRAIIFIGDVSRIEFDGAPASSDISSAPRETPRDMPPVEPPREQPREQPRDTQPEEQPREQPRETPRETPAEPPAADPEPARPVSTTPAERPASRRPTGPVRTATIDVTARRDWTSTGLIVKRGDIIRITATGTITIDPATGQTSGPEGVDVPDARKLMSDQPTGALIAVIGADNDDFIFIGRSAEFTAARDGLLFLSVNEGALSDNQGTFKATIEVQQQRR